MSVIARPSLWRSLLDRLIGVILAVGDFLLDDEGNWLLDADGDFRLHNADGACPECCQVFCYQFIDCCDATISFYRSTVELDTGNQMIEGICGELSSMVCDEPPAGPLIGPGDLTPILDCGEATCPDCPSRTCFVDETECCVGDIISVTTTVSQNITCTPCDPEVSDCTGECAVTEESCAAYTSCCNGIAAELSSTFSLHWDANEGAWVTSATVSGSCGAGGLRKANGHCTGIQVYTDCFNNCAAPSCPDGLSTYHEYRSDLMSSLDASSTCGNVTLNVAGSTLWGNCALQGSATITWTDPGDCGLP